MSKKHYWIIGGVVGGGAVLVGLVCCVGLVWVALASKDRVDSHLVDPVQSTAQKKAIAKPVEQQDQTGEQKGKTETRADTQTKNEEAKAIDVDAGDLIRLFSENEVKANGLYKGKRLKVTGLVYRVTNKAVELKGRKAGANRVEAFIVSGDEGQVGAFVKGQALIVEGICQGKQIDIVLRDCKFSEAP